MEKSIEGLLDIFIITFNRANHLDNTLKELLDASSPIRNFNIQIFDNKSTDNTEEIVKKWQKNFPNVSYEKNKYNIGGNANIMKAFYSANKDYVWVLADNDLYNWDSWNEVEEAILQNKDAIVISNHDFPKIDIAQFMVETTFLPGVIYKRNLIDDEVMANMSYSISNMFPHLAISTKLINENKDITIVNHAVVESGDNRDESGLYEYVRGYDKKNTHPLMNDLNWLAGYANSLHMISDKAKRNYIATHNLFGWPAFTSARIFYINRKVSNGSLYNLLSIFSVLNFTSKCHFILNWVLYYTLFRIIYIYAKNDKPDWNKGVYIRQYRLHLFNLINTKIFSRRIKIKK